MLLKEIIDAVPTFKTEEEKEKFLLDVVEYEFSYLKESDIDIEKTWDEGSF